MTVTEGNVDWALRALLGVTLIVVGTWTILPTVVAAALVIVGLVSLFSSIESREEAPKMRCDPNCCEQIPLGWTLSTITAPTALTGETHLLGVPTTFV